ncbi:HAD-IA family hydrolase [Halosquirtibacter xylanolyticus]|uniref:HAD family hydrolase n=1 Tax=Halosquirtibacter xylanolyticus TaxID=3374599 RepID=UPI0037482E52|nr:HAD-IA family hydrolase [Prolixibacteraceae bacterium]
MEKEIVVSKNIKGLIFDIDGTIADSMPVHFLVFQKVAKKYGVDYTKELFLELAGIPALETCEIVRKRYGKQWSAAEFAKEKEETYLNHMHQVRAVGPVMQIIEKYKGKLPMACGTGGDRYSASKVLDILGLDFLKDKMVCAEDVTHHKPHPETFLKAAELIDVAPENCLVFEDGALGIQAAVDGGMQVVDVTKYYQTTIGEDEGWTLSGE